MRFSHVVIIIGVFLLVAIGLNISNQGINDLTLEKQGAILALGFEEGNVDMQILGRTYTCQRDRLSNMTGEIIRQVSDGRREAQAYLDHYHKIFDAIVNSDR
ncbi:MAG: hypothetical protein ACM3PE_07075 [Deltaproteobacteria bacterium]